MVTVKKVITQDYETKHGRATGSICTTTKYFLGIRFMKYHEVFTETYIAESKTDIGFKK
jgi:hypothetical protein